MKTVDELLEYDFQCYDNRDKSKIVDFLTVEQLSKIGAALVTRDTSTHKVIPMTKEVVIEQLKFDALLGQDAALNKRLILALMEYHVVRMWLWILEDPLYDVYTEDTYYNYGLELFERVIDKYVLEGGKIDEA